MLMSSGERTARGHLSKAVNVSDLNVPESQRAAKKAGHMFRQFQADAATKKTFPAYVLKETYGSLDRVQVLIDGTATSARLNTEVKAVKTGDTVRVRKSGGLWEVVASETWRDPPKVGGTMGRKPSSSGTVSRTPSNVPNTPVNISSTGTARPASPPGAPTETLTPGSPPSSVLAWSRNAQAHLTRMESWGRNIRGVVMDVRTDVTVLAAQSQSNRNTLNALRSTVDALKAVVNEQRSTINQNASRLNEVRDYAGNAGDLVSPVVDALADERIVRK